MNDQNQPNQQFMGGGQQSNSQKNLILVQQLLAQQQQQQQLQQAQARAAATAGGVSSMGATAGLSGLPSQQMVPTSQTHQQQTATSQQQQRQLYNFINQQQNNQGAGQNGLVGHQLQQQVQQQAQNPQSQTAQQFQQHGLRQQSAGVGGVGTITVGGQVAGMGGIGGLQQNQSNTASHVGLLQGAGAASQGNGDQMSSQIQVAQNNASGLMNQQNQPLNQFNQNAQSLNLQQLGDQAGRAGQMLQNQNYLNQILISGVQGGASSTQQQQSLQDIQQQKSNILGGGGPNQGQQQQNLASAQQQSSQLQAIQNQYAQARVASSNSGATTQQQTQQQIVFQQQQTGQTNLVDSQKQLQPQQQNQQQQQNQLLRAISGGPQSQQQNNKFNQQQLRNLFAANQTSGGLNQQQLALNSSGQMVQQPNSLANQSYTSQPQQILGQMNPQLQELLQQQQKQQQQTNLAQGSHGQMQLNLQNQLLGKKAQNANGLVANNNTGLGGADGGTASSAAMGGAGLGAQLNAAANNASAGQTSQQQQQQLLTNQGASGASNQHQQKVLQDMLAAHQFQQQNQQQTQQLIQQQNTAAQQQQQRATNNNNTSQSLMHLNNQQQQQTPQKIQGLSINLAGDGGGASQQQSNIIQNSLNKLSGANSQTRGLNQQVQHQLDQLRQQQNQQQQLQKAGGAQLQQFSIAGQTQAAQAQNSMGLSHQGLGQLQQTDPNQASQQVPSTGPGGDPSQHQKAINQANLQSQQQMNLNNANNQMNKQLGIGQQQFQQQNQPAQILDSGVLQLQQQQQANQHNVYQNQHRKSFEQSLQAAAVNQANQQTIQQQQNNQTNNNQSVASSHQHQQIQNQQINLSNNTQQQPGHDGQVPNPSQQQLNLGGTTNIHQIQFMRKLNGQPAVNQNNQGVLQQQLQSAGGVGGGIQAANMDSTTNQANQLQLNQNQQLNLQQQNNQQQQIDQKQRLNLDNLQMPIANLATQNNQRANQNQSNLDANPQSQQAAATGLAAGGALAAQGAQNQPKNSGGVQSHLLIQKLNKLSSEQQQKQGNEEKKQNQTGQFDVNNDNKANPEADAQNQAANKAADVANLKLPTTTPLPTGANGELPQNLPGPETISNLDAGSDGDNMRYVERLNKLAEHCATNGEYQAAIEYYIKLITISSDNGPAWTALGHCYLLVEDLQNSFNAYQRALYSLEDIKDPQLWYGIGILYEKFESYDHAISALIAVLKMSPNFYQKTEVLYKLGMIFAKTNQIQQAIGYFQNSILTKTFTLKRKTDTLIKIGLLYEEQQNHAQAMREYKAALIGDKTNYKTYQHLAWCSFQMGQVQQALEYINNVDQLNPGQADTLYIKGRCFMALDDNQKALELLQEAAFKYPGEAAYWATLAIVYYKNGDYCDSFENIIKATSLNTLKSEIWYNLGILYEKCKQPEEALIAYSKVQDLQNGEEDSLKRINAIQSHQYSTPNGQNQSILNLQMKQPMFRLPNSLSILKKYKKQRSNQDAEGGESNRLLGAAVGGTSAGPNAGQSAADQQRQQVTANSSNMPGGQQIHLNNLGANPAAPVQGLQDNKIETQVNENAITGGNFDQSNQLQHQQVEQQQFTNPLANNNNQGLVQATNLQQQPPTLQMGNANNNQAATQDNQMIQQLMNDNHQNQLQQLQQHQPQQQPQPSQHQSHLLQFLPNQQVQQNQASQMAMNRPTDQQNTSIDQQAANNGNQQNMQQIQHQQQAEAPQGQASMGDSNVLQGGQQQFNANHQLMKMNYGKQTENENVGGDGATAQALQVNQVAVQNQLGNNDLSVAASVANNNAQQLQANQVVDAGANAAAGANSGGAIAGNHDMSKQINDGGANVNAFATSQQQQQDANQIQQHMQNQQPQEAAAVQQQQQMMQGQASVQNANQHQANEQATTSFQNMGQQEQQSISQGALAAQLERQAQPQNQQQQEEAQQQNNANSGAGAGPAGSITINGMTLEQHSLRHLQEQLKHQQVAQPQQTQVVQQQQPASQSGQQPDAFQLHYQMYLASGANNAVVNASTPNGAVNAQNNASQQQAQNPDQQANLTNQAVALQQQQNLNQGIGQNNNTMPPATGGSSMQQQQEACQQQTVPAAAGQGEASIVGAGQQLDQQQAESQMSTNLQLLQQQQKQLEMQLNQQQQQVQVQQHELSSAQNVQHATADPQQQVNNVAPASRMVDGGVGSAELNQQLNQFLQAQQQQQQATDQTQQDPTQQSQHQMDPQQQMQGPYDTNEGQQ